MGRVSSMLALAALLVLAVCASCASASQLVFSVSAAEQAYLNALHSPAGLSHARALESAFAALDSDADGELSASEMDEHEASGRMSAAERALVAAFDRDDSGSLSAAELLLAPHALNLLETSVQFDALRPVRQSAQERAAAEAFDGMQTQTRAQPLYRLKSRRAPAAQQASEWGADQSLSEIGAWAEPAAAAAAAPAAAAAGAAPAAAAQRVPGQRRPSTRASKGSRRGTAPLPVSLFGVPSVADEECVMCQYFVQRIQNDIAERLEKAPGAAGSAAESPKASAAGAAGLKAGAAAAQQALKVRSLNGQLQKRPGGRGIVRVVTEDVVSRLCAVDRMPQLFYPYCMGLSESNAIHAVRKAIFFNIPTVEVCSQAALCRDDSYLNTNAAVHATKTSLFLNGQRGICGMLGGARDRPNSREGLLLNAVCAAHGVVFGEMLVQ